LFPDEASCYRIFDQHAERIEEPEHVDEDDGWLWYGEARRYEGTISQMMRVEELRKNHLRFLWIPSCVQVVTSMICTTVF